MIRRTQAVWIIFAAILETGTLALLLQFLKEGLWEKINLGHVAQRTYLYFVLFAPQLAIFSNTNIAIMLKSLETMGMSTINIKIEMLNICCTPEWKFYGKLWRFPIDTINIDNKEFLQKFFVKHDLGCFSVFRSRWLGHLHRMGME